MPIVSVIVPVYNAEKSIGFCINSILSQTFTEFELILIDDGSIDKSGEICDFFSKKDNRITVVHRRNNGVSSARNTGLDIAIGKYICFVDSDDFLEKNYLQEMVDAQNIGYSIAFCRFYNVNSYSFSDISTDYSIYEDNYRNVKIDDYKYLAISDIMSQPWNKIFKKSIIDEYNIRMPEDLSLGEDMLFVFEYLDHIIDEEFLLINKPLYNYFNGNEQSLVNKFRKDLFKTNCTLNHRLSVYVHKWNFSEENLKYFNNSLFFRMENVLINTFKKENNISFLSKLIYNNKVMRTKEFKYWFSKFDGNMNLLYKISYKLKLYLPVVLLKKISNTITD